MMQKTDVLVVGAGITGASCAFYAARAGLTVTVVDRRSVAGGTTGAGEGNVLVSDKEPGPELDLALLSSRLWRRLAVEVGGFEYEPKGGLVVAATAGSRTGLGDLEARQRAAGVEVVPVTSADLPGYEPHLARELAGGAFYPQDAQVQPMLAAARLLRASGARVRTGVTVTELIRAGDRIVGVRTDQDEIAAGVVVNAAGTWGGEIAALAGVEVPVLPRRGFVLVTEPLPPLIRHKVYAAEYVADVASDDEGLETSAVVEGTRAGTVLIGASRERVGFDRGFSLPVLRRLARQAIALFPVLEDVATIRAYHGFRPYCPDHLPVLGPDPRAEGLLHACGHEGAGVGLAAATGHALAQVLTGEKPDLDLTPFRPERFTEAS
ncbi:FAD-dependent oxidoreductase [Actinoallomurus oryzae]|uniref:FAD-dependent oxidoreductase n=2 Tax=Actinoallomurus oryzae TaxID=502180 RepID=A0ABP8PX05_9ACTN